MSLKRILLSFAITFACALAVFTLPRFVWNTVHAAVAQEPPAAQSTPTPAAPSAPALATPQAPPAAPVSLPMRLTGLLGMALILLVGYALSRNRSAINWQTIGWGLGLQIAFAVFVLRVPFGQELFRWLGAVVTRILSFSYVGSEFVFGDLGAQHSKIGVVFAFQILPAIIFVSALFAILYYLGVMQVVVKAMAIAMNNGQTG